MTIWYVDPANGNDSTGTGVDFAHAWKTVTSGATSARIAAADTVRIAKSPDPTSTSQNAQFTKMAATDGFSAGAMTAATNASPIVVTRATHGLVTGDRCCIVGALGNTAANGEWTVTVSSSSVFSLNGSTGNGAWTSGGTVTKTSGSTVVLTTAVTANIDTCDSGWTAANSATVTNSYTTNYKEGAGAVRVVLPASGITTSTLYAFHATGSLSLSAYQQISFWARASATTASIWKVCLCSDTAGATPVYTANISVPTANVFTPITIDTGSAMSTTIQSVAIYSAAVAPAASATLVIDNIIACKTPSAADSITLTSLVGKNYAYGVEGWHGLQSINGVYLRLGNHNEGLPSPISGYGGTTESVTLYKREPFALGSTTSTTQRAGTSPSALTVYSGGWDTTSVVQNGETFFDGLGFNGTGFTCASNYISVDHISIVRYDIGQAVNGTVIYASYSCNTIANCGTTGVYAGGASGIAFNSWNITNLTNGGTSQLFILGNCGNTINIVNIWSSPNVGINLTGTFSISGNKFTHSTIYGCVGNQIVLNKAFNNVFNVASMGLNGNVGIFVTIQGDNVFNNTVFIVGTVVTANAFDINANLNTGMGYLYLNNVTLSAGGGAGGPVNYGQDNSNVGIFIEKNGQVNGAAYQYFGGGSTIQTDTGTVHTAGTSWKFTPIAPYTVSQFPMSLTVATVLVNSGSLVTATLWVRRSSTTTTGVSLVCEGGQIAGVASDVVATSSASANTWDQLTITFTPSEVGVIQIKAKAYSASAATIFVDDFGISQ